MITGHWPVHSVTIGLHISGLTWFLYTEMAKKVCPRLRDPASWPSLAAGASSRRLGQTFLVGLLMVQRPWTQRSVTLVNQPTNYPPKSSFGYLKS